VLQQPPEKPARNLDEWDAEIEAEFRRVVRATKTASAPNASRRMGWLRKYTLVPREWEQRLLDAKRISTYRLAHEILYLHWYGKGKPVTVSGKVARAVKISARSKWEALAELERLGLIVVDRNPRRSPRVTPLHTQAPKSWA
jgi:hypothetical protein